MLIYYKWKRQSLDGLKGVISGVLDVVDLNSLANQVEEFLEDGGRVTIYKIDRGGSVLSEEDRMDREKREKIEQLADKFVLSWINKSGLPLEEKISSVMWFVNDVNAAAGLDEEEVRNGHENRHE